MRSIQMLRPWLVAGTMAGAVVVFATCKKDPTAPVNVATTNLTAAVTTGTVAALANLTFSVPDAGGISPSLAGQAATVSFSNTSSPTPTMTIGSGGQTASGTTTFGSCILTITSSSFPASSALGLGKTLVINPCNITVATSGSTAGSSNRGVSLVLGSSTSTGLVVPVVLSNNGSVSLGGVTLGTVNVTPTSGG